MSRTKLIEAYSGFDTPDMPQRIAECISSYIEREGIEELPWRELHGRHTGHLDISDGGFRMAEDFLYPVLDLCKLDRKGILSADMNKINGCLEQWRVNLINPPKFDDEEEMPDDMDDEYFDASEYDDDDNLYEFRNASYMAEMDSYMGLESPSDTDMIAHENNLEEIWSLKNDSYVDDDDNIEVHEREYTDEEIAIYEQAVHDMYMKEKAQLETCRSIFYQEGKDALQKFLLSKESYIPNPKYDWSFDDPDYFNSTQISKIREKFNVWNEDKSARELEEMYLEERSQPSFAEFVSDLRRGIYGELPEDYDGLARQGDPGYYSDEDLDKYQSKL